MKLQLQTEIKKKERIYGLVKIDFLEPKIDIKKPTSTYTNSHKMC